MRPSVLRKSWPTDFLERNMASAAGGAEAAADLPFVGPVCTFPVVLNFVFWARGNAILLLLTVIIILFGTVHRWAEERGVTSIRQWRLLLKPPPPKAATEFRATVTRGPKRKDGKGKGRR